MRFAPDPTRDVVAPNEPPSGECWKICERFKQDSRNLLHPRLRFRTVKATAHHSTRYPITRFSNELTVCATFRRCHRFSGRDTLALAPRGSDDPRRSWRSCGWEGAVRSPTSTRRCVIGRGRRKSRAWGSPERSTPSRSKLGGHENVCSTESSGRGEPTAGGGGGEPTAGGGGTASSPVPSRRRRSAASRSFAQSTCGLSGTAHPARALASANRLIVLSATTRSGSLFVTPP